MLRFLRLLRGYVWRAFLQQLTWRGFLLTLVLNQTVTPLLGLAVWSAAVPGSSTIDRYYVAVLAVQLLTVSYESHTFSNGIYAGALSADLVKPQPVVIITLGTNLALRTWHVIMGMPIIIGAGILVGATFDLRSVLLAVPAVLLAAGLRFLFTYVLALSAFWSQQATGVVALGETLIFLIGGVAAPLALLPRDIRAVGEALPFAAMLGFPGEVASGAVAEGQLLVGFAWQIVWTGVFLALARVVWSAGIRRYLAVGG